MGAKDMRFRICPDCGKHGVSLRLGSHQDDGYGCRYCNFWAYAGGMDSIDELNRNRLRAANGEMQVVEIDA